MAYTSHIFVAIGGRMGTDEQWQTGFRMWSGSDNSDADYIERAGDWLDNIADHVETWWTAVQGSLSGAAHFDFVKVNAIGPNGRYLGPVTNARYYEPNESGHTGTAAPFPFQCALALSLVTPLTRGMASKGRMYLPVSNGSVDPNTGRLTTSQPDTLALRTSELFSAVNDNPGLDTSQTRVAIMSSTGAHQDVIGVKAGKVVDTQRRRRRSLDEDYGQTYVVEGQG